MQLFYQLTWKSRWCLGRTPGTEARTCPAHTSADTPKDCPDVLDAQGVLSVRRCT